MTALRSLLFNIVFFAWTAVASIGMLWVLLAPRRVMVAMVRFHLGTVAWLERTLLGLDYEVRGAEHMPQGPFILAAKHQSAWETMKLHFLVGDPAVVLKKELTWIPIWGWYAAKSQMIAVDRSKRGRAIPSLIEGAARIKAAGRPIVIFPQGTRVAVGKHAPYKVGVGVLYEQLNLPIVPMALDSGLYWPRRSFLKRPGRIVVEFLPPIPPGKPRGQVMAELEERLEAATDRLVMAAGGPATRRHTPACG
ncbi:MAG TPA: lysophospholipid acyltransferase family protein [Azospirillaceae bacterium]|nr:lysophospholipid acyltransferase family protein [Azospirillaceae bacterium]